MSVMRKSVAILGGLILGNAAAWGCALIFFAGRPLLLGVALIAYTLGLRHAVDADHIAAIDNVTRKLMQRGQRPVSVGLWFSLGHSSVVILASAGIALLSATLRSRMSGLRVIGDFVGTGVSASFLFLIALANIAVLISVWRDVQLTSQFPGGLLGRLLRPVMKLISASWQMYPLGFLFGLGFDTASEIALLGISAGQASQAMPLWSIMVFPALFTAGMSLVDTADGALMVGAYGWAFASPQRRRLYNFGITLASVVVALGVGSVEAIHLIVSDLPVLAHRVVLLGIAGISLVAFFGFRWGVSMVAERPSDA